MLGFAATFVVGLASGVILLSDEAPDTRRPATHQPGRAAHPARPRRCARWQCRRPAPVAVREVEPPVPPVVAAPVAVAPPAPEPPPPAPVAAAAAPDLGGDDTGEPVEVASVSLPLPPVAPKAPVHKARTPDRIDRACTQAVFRFQQGLPLSAAEQAHVRNGCATRR